MSGFKFNLGFCGINYLLGSPSEIEGKKELVKNAGKFSWFDHTYSHVQPHKIKYEKLVEEMTKNKQFAQVRLLRGEIIIITINVIKTSMTTACTC